jgi:prevent-host-death family protein
MNIPLSDAKGRLTELVRRAEAGDEIVLTRHGQPVARIVPVAVVLDVEDLRARRLAAIDRAIREARERGPDGGPSAARAADYLYDDKGLPA